MDLTVLPLLLKMPPGIEHKKQRSKKGTFRHQFDGPLKKVKLELARSPAHTHTHFPISSEPINHPLGRRNVFFHFSEKHLRKMSPPPGHPRSYGANQEPGEILAESCDLSAGVVVVVVNLLPPHGRFCGLQVRLKFCRS